MVRCVKLEKMVRKKYDNDIFRLKAVSLLRQIEEAKEFLSYHKPSLGFWGEHLLRGFYARICLMMSKSHKVLLP